MKHLVVDGLLVFALVIELASAVGVLLMRDAYQRLHYAAAATTLGPIAIAIAVVIQQSFSAPGMKAILTAAVLLAGGALAVHATGRAAVIRARGGWRIDAPEIEEQRG